MLKIKFRVCFAFFALILSACGGGGGGGSISVTPPSIFSITGEWRVMSPAGIYKLNLNEAAGTLQYARPDELTGVAVNTSLSGMTRGSDSAYLFDTGFSSSGLPLNISFYRVDNNTIAGQILSSLDGTLKLSPFVASRAILNDFTSISGDWNAVASECGYDTLDKRCEVSGIPLLQVLRYSVAYNNLTFSVCTDDLRISLCAPANKQSFSANSIGEGIIQSGDDLFVAFPVAGSTHVFSHVKYATGAPTYLITQFLAPEAALSFANLNGTWRAATATGRTGSVTINNNTVSLNINGLAAASGTLSLTDPWVGLSRIDVSGSSRDYYLVGSSKLLFLSSDENFMILHRE